VDVGNTQYGGERGVPVPSVTIIFMLQKINQICVVMD
jgi:hypothetical protein